MSGNFIQATPFLTARSIEKSVAFYRDRLGFMPFVEDRTYAYLGRGEAGIRLLVHSPEDGPFAAGTGYIDVRDVESIVQEHSTSWTDLPEGTIRGPIDQGYNQRELFVRDPDSNLIIFGQGIGPNASQWDNRD